MTRSYSELIQLPTFEERFSYLQLNGAVCADTFGFDRIFNQKFYRSKEWRDLRNYIISRDNGCDLGIEGHDIFDKIIIHHMNPISLRDIEEATDYLMNPEYLICVSHNTHNAIHYGTEEQLTKNPIERRPGDTCLWR